MKKIALIALMMVLGVAMMAGQARADVTYGSNLFDGLDQNGVPMADGTYVMVIDTDNDGWGLSGAGLEANVAYTAQAPLGVYRPGQQRNDQTWLWDSNDYIMARGPIGSVQGQNGEWDGAAFVFSTVSIPNVPGYTPEVDHFYILWFNTPYNADATGPGSNIWYGAEDLGLVGKEGYTITNDPVGGTANLVTVPEPISIFLGLMGGAALVARRKFSGKA
jgi:hypothetical protein